VTQSQDDNVIISSALLIASTFYQRGVRWMLESIREILAHLNKQLTNHILATDRARNCRRKEMVSIYQFSFSTHQKLGNLRCQTCDCVEQQSYNKVAWLCCMSDMGLKVKAMTKFSMGNLMTELRVRVSFAIWDHTVLLATQHQW